MAIITQSQSGGGDGPITGWSIKTPAPAGQHVAVCLAVKDTLGYECPTYDDPTVTEVKDVTRFLFGLADGSMVQTYEMKISSNEKSKLFNTLTSWLGHPPVIGFDTESMVGMGATISIVGKVSRKGTEYSDVTSITPVMPQLASQVPNLANFTVPQDNNPPSAPAQPVAPVQPVQPMAPAQVATTVTVDQPQAVQPMQTVQPVQQVVQQPVQQVQPVQPIQQPAQGQQTLGGQFTPPPSESVPF
jgi:hypothetical protein